jgi:2'-5' RNA ligase
MPEGEAERFLAVLKKPPLDNMALITKFNIPKHERGTLAATARELMLEDPDLAFNPSALQREVERVLSRTFRVAKRLDTVWVVTDPGPDSEIIDILFSTSNMRTLGNVIRGSRDWDRQHPAFHDDLQSAHKDAVGRLRRIHGGDIPSWVLANEGQGFKMGSLRVAAPKKYEHIDFKPPESVANAAEKGLEYRQKASPSNRGGLTTEEAAKEGIGSGVQRAVNLKNRNTLSPQTVKQMHGFFSRHEKNKGVSPENKGEPWNDKGHVAWLLWGGDPGKAWAGKIMKQMETADAKKAAKGQSVEMGEAQMKKLHEDGEVEIDGVSISYKEAAEDYGLEGGKNEPTNEALWEKVLGEAKAKFDVYPSAAASAWAVQRYNEQGGGWSKKAVDHAVSYMSVQHLRELESHARDLAGQIDQNTMLPDWVEAKITEAAVQLRNVYEYMTHGRTAAVTGKGDSVGLFIPLPEDLAALYPKLTEDTSPPHVTLLYVGEVPKDRELDFLAVLQDVLGKEPGPVQAWTNGVDKFVHPVRGRTVFYTPIRFSRDMGSVRDKLTSALTDAGFEVENSFPLAYHAHTTLGYHDGTDLQWTGDVPDGAWEFNSVQVWGLSKVHEVPLGSYDAYLLELEDLRRKNAAALRADWGPLLED